MTVREVASELGVSASLVYGLCAAGRIRHERHGLGRGTIRIPRDALDEYRKAAEAKPAAPAAGELRHITLR
jgi:excisionase family DNA binding protein